ncbi:MAG: PfkB family carbohydrate kinase [Candidatus Marinimicrobia bacterium]|nr:PfkB family carbohydrate kinase [Candidatus Neomarinimicrobiota bacterium]
MTNNSLLIVGSIALDLIETPQGRKENVIGGSTTYGLIAAGRSIPVSIVGVIGDDFPQTGHDLYDTYASNLNDLQILEGMTFRWGGRYHENWDERDTLYTELGVFADFNPTLSPSNQKCSHIFLANIHPALQQSVMDQNQNGKAMIVVDTMNLWINIALEELKRVLSGSNALLINESEAAMLTGFDSAESCARALQDLGLQTVVIKKGSRGAELFSNDEHITIGAFPVKQVIDPTGAGDTFGGGFIATLASGGSMADAMVEGSALASLCVEGFGTERILSASGDEINQRIAYLKSTVKS